MCRIKIILCLLIISGACAGQSFDQLEMRSFNESQGLSYNMVNCFYKDKKGFLWIGTEDGLNRFDGADNKIFRQHHYAMNSLPGNNILSITGDDSTGLWILTLEGVVHFFPDDETVLDYTLASCEGKPRKIAGTLGKLFFDAHHTLCLINDFGISFFNRQKNVFELHKIHFPFDSVQINRITDFIQEDENTLLLLGYYGIIRYNTLTHKYDYSRVSFNYFESHPNIPLIGFIKNSDGKFWITTAGHGLIIIDEKENSAKSHLVDTNKVNKKFRNLLNFIEKPQQGIFKDDIVIGTFGNGMHIVKPDQQQDFSGFEHTDNSNNLPDAKWAKDMITNYCMYTDENNISFIGSATGVFIIHPGKQIFRKYNSQFGGIVSDIIKKNTPDHKTRYYFSSYYNGGFHIYDDQLNQTKSYKNIPPEATNSRSTNVGSLCVDNKNRLWIGSDNGLYLFDETKDKFIAYLPDAKNANSISYDRITEVFQDHAGIFWIGLSVKGFECFDPVSNKFYLLPMHTPANDTYVFNIIEDGEMNIWLGLNYGIVRIDSARNSFVEFRHNKNDSLGISNDEPQCFFLDREKRMWIGTKNGLNLYQPEAKAFKKYFREDGLSGDYIYSISQSPNGNIWVGTNFGLSVLDPATDRITSYKNVSATAVFCDQNGKVIVGSGGGPSNFVVCNEDAIKNDSLLPKVYITNLKITGESKEFRNVSTSSLKSIELKYTENYLTFDFTGLSFNDANLNQFKCRLLGLESNWNMIGTIRSISYAALNPGEYDFEVMCCNGAGIWNPETGVLHVSILPPFWKTGWFRILIAALFASGTYYIYLLRIKKIKEEESINKKLAQLETQALQAQMNPHFIFNALNSIQACIVSNNNDAAYKYLNKFSVLVRSILQNSREQFISLSSELTVLKNYLELEQLRFKDLEFNFIADEKINANKIKVPSAFLQPFVENAIIHGLAHKEGKKRLGINISESDKDFIFKITDNGIGRKTSAEINKKRTKSHTSIGVELITSRLKLINEQFGISSKINIADLVNADQTSNGTEVKIILPKSLQDELF